MKIGKKFILSNILISLIAMIILSITISTIVSNYIEQDMAVELIKENELLIKWFEYKKGFEFKNDNIYFDETFYKSFSKTPITRIVFISDVNNSNNVLIQLNRKTQKFTDDELNKIFLHDLEKVYDINISEKLHLAYNNIVKIDLEGTTFSILVTTLIPNMQIKEIINQIVKVLIAAIIIISALSIVVTSYIGRKITKPIENLKRITDKIANNNFDEKAVVNTGDELERLAISINNMADSIKKHDLEQKKFYENISHELKTPLTVISGYAQGIKTNIFDDDEKALDTIIEESAQLKKQLENVIYLSKLDSINEFYNFEKISMNDIISNAIKKVDSIIILNDIDIIYEPIDNVILSIDKDKIIRMLINILSNCLKYTKDTIEIITEVNENWYQLKISDNGKGFSKKILSNPFGRIMVGEKEGTGIGLSIVKKIIDAHNGNITLDNNKDGGAVYIVKLPIS